MADADVPGARQVVEPDQHRHAGRIPARDATQRLARTDEVHEARARAGVRPACAADNAGNAKRLAGYDPIRIRQPIGSHDGCDAGAIACCQTAEVLAAAHDVDERRGGPS